MEKHEEGSFGYDLKFLQDRDSLILLKNEGGNAQVIVSAKYQGKVFTSTADGEKGKSFGWINYKAFDGPLDPHMNGYGGEDRLWLGPEGGKYSVFFKQGAKMVFENWHTPAAIDSEGWNLISSDEKQVSMSKDVVLQNYVGTVLDLRLDRRVEIFENSEIERTLGIKTEEGVKAVGFQTFNTLTNTGKQAWDENTGAPCMWNLDMFSPSPSTIIVIPYESKGSGKVATTDYFGQIPPDRVVTQQGTLFFKADGKSRGKLGLPPERAKPIAGSYDAENSVLTITMFDIDKKGVYLNQEWSPDRNPLIGDAVNAYNDGPLPEGGQMGPFYELESVSPAAFLKPGEKLDHRHAVFHFTGDKISLDRISQKTLGVSLDQIESAFKK